MYPWTGKDKSKYPFTPSLPIMVIGIIITSILIYREYTQTGKWDSSPFIFLVTVVIVATLFTLSYKIKAGLYPLSGGKFYKTYFMYILGAIMLALVLTVVLLLFYGINPF